MKYEDSVEFMTIMTTLYENFGKKISPEGLSLRFDALGEYKIEQVKRAAIGILQDKTYNAPPTIAEFIERIEIKSEGLAEEQVITINKAISQIGFYGQPKFRDPITKALFQDRFSWQTVCSMTYPELEWFYKDFKNSYTSYKSIFRLRCNETPIKIDSIKELLNKIKGV